MKLAKNPDLTGVVSQHDRGCFQTTHALFANMARDIWHFRVLCLAKKHGEMAQKPRFICPFSLLVLLAENVSLTKSTGC